MSCRQGGCPACRPPRGQLFPVRQRPNRSRGPQRSSCVAATARAAGQRRTRAAGALGGGPAAPSSPGPGRGTGVGASPGSCPEGFCGQSHAKSRKRRHTVARPPPLTRVTRSRLTARSGASSGLGGGGRAGASRTGRGAGAADPRLARARRSDAVPRSAGETPTLKAQKPVRGAPRSALRSLTVGLRPKAMKCDLAFRGTAHVCPSSPPATAHPVAPPPGPSPPAARWLTATRPAILSSCSNPSSVSRKGCW